MCRQVNVLYDIKEGFGAKIVPLNGTSERGSDHELLVFLPNDKTPEGVRVNTGTHRALGLFKNDSQLKAWGKELFEKQQL